MGKVFALLWTEDGPPRLNVKCDPFTQSYYATHTKRRLHDTT